MPDGLGGEEQAIYFSKVRKFFDFYACSRVMRRRNKMSDEYILKEGAIDVVNHALDRETILFSFVRKVAISALKKTTPADAAPVVHAYWIDTENYYRRWRCSACTGHTKETHPPFCPFCGAKMDAQGEGEKHDME